MLFPSPELGGQLPCSFPEALSVFEQQAKGGDPVACACVGTMLLFGWGVQQDFAAARPLLITARLRRHARGYTGMGMLLANGWGGEALDYTEAFKNLRRGAEMVGEHVQQLCGLHVATPAL